MTEGEKGSVLETRWTSKQKDRKPQRLTDGRITLGEIEIQI